MHVCKSVACSSRLSFAQAFARPLSMSSFAEFLEGFESEYTYTDETLELGTGKPKLRNFNHRGDDSGPGTPLTSHLWKSPPIIVWSSPSSLGSPLSDQGIIVPEPPLNWHERQQNELRKIRVEKRTHTKSGCKKVTKRKCKSSAKTKSSKSKATKENNGNNNKGKETKEKKV